MKNPQHGVLSKAYSEFPDPLSKGREGGFDVHIYHFQVAATTLTINSSRSETNASTRTTQTKSHTPKRYMNVSDENVSSA
jgi:hypothetical protein